jgi:site-specific DNA-adenine methylase
MKKKSTKWRGISTTQKRIHEKEAITTINRLGQKSISLPRIDDKKRWAGYPALAGTAQEIANMIQSCKYFVEPFAGTAKVYQELIKIKETKIEHYILNDTSDFIYKWLIREFHDATVTNEDFTKCIARWDSPETFFLLDPAWNKPFYLQKFSSFNRKSVGAYYEEVIELCKKMQGKFIIASREENTLIQNSGFKNRTIKSKYVVSGHYPRVLLTSNLEWEKDKTK